jgi:hypothetical protein
MKNQITQYTDANNRHYRAEGYFHKQNRDVERGVIAFACVAAMTSIALYCAAVGV